MKLDGIHHITAITADAPGNVDFYARVLGLRLVKKTVNQDDPTVYHLFYGDEAGDPGADLTFFEYPGAARGEAGDGMVHTVGWRVASGETLDFWAERLGGEGTETTRSDDRLRFEDPEGLAHELEVYRGDEAPLTAEAADIPAEHALQGFAGARAYSNSPDSSESLLGETLGFERAEGDAWTLAGGARSSYYVYDAAPSERARPGAGTVHHIAFASELEDHEAWRERVAAAGMEATPVIDRFYFKSVYFREPSGVLFELATKGPGFTADEPLESLGEKLSLPPNFESLRDQVEQTLTPLPNPRG